MILATKEVGARHHGLLQDRVAAAFAVVLGREESPAVVVVKDDMLAFVSDDVADSVEVFGMFSNKKRSGSERSNHSRGVNITALVVERTRILGSSHSDIRRIPALSIFEPIGLRYEDGVIRVMQVT